VHLQRSVGFPRRDLQRDAVVEVLIPAGSRLIGQSLRETRFSQRFNSTVLAIRRGEEILRDRLGQVSLRLGDALLLQCPPATVPGLQVSRDLLLLDGDAVADDRGERRPWSLGLMLALLLLTLWRSDLLVVWALLAAVGMVLGRALTPQEVYASVRWDVVVLLAALLPLAELINRSGVDQWLVEHLVAQVDQFPAYAVLTSLYLVTSLVTEIVSNQAAVTLMLPLGLSLTHNLGVNPLAVMGDELAIRLRRMVTEVRQADGELRADTLVRGAFGDLEDDGIVDVLGVTREEFTADDVQIVVMTDRNLANDPGAVLGSMISIASPVDDQQPIVTVVAEVGRVLQDNETPVPSFVTTIRDSGRLRDEVSTVDNAETFLGWIATVLAMRTALAGDVGHYGFRDGAERSIPPSPT
jgi:hypothetical protein